MKVAATSPSATVPGSCTGGPGGTAAGHALAEPRMRSRRHFHKSENDRGPGPVGLKNRSPSQWSEIGKVGMVRLRSAEGGMRSELTGLGGSETRVDCHSAIRSPNSAIYR